MPPKHKCVAETPVSDSIARYSKERAGRKDAGLWSFVASFRVEKQKTKAPGPASAAPKRKPRTVSSSIPKEDAAAAQASAEVEVSARQSMVDMGFSSVDITAALERTDFAFGPALLLLLNGLDTHRHLTDNKQSERFCRQGVKYVFSIKNETELIGSSVFSQYKQRMFESFELSAAVFDLGQYAGNTSGACFWFCLAAGLAECNEDVLGQALPAEHDALAVVAHLRSEGAIFRHAIYNDPVDIRYSALGELAASLREYFCSGPIAVLLRPDKKDKIYAAFASLPVRGKQRTEQLYESWVHKLAFKEYADELVVLAVALELSIRIVVIPYTPEFALEHGKIPTYGPAVAAQDASRTVYLGNNDVHFVYLKQKDAIAQALPGH